MFCLLVVLVKLSVLAKCLARKTSEDVYTKPRQKSAYDFFSLVFVLFFHHFIVCLYCCLALHDIAHTPMAQYSLFVMKVPLHTSQPTNHCFLGLSCGGGLTDKSY